MTKQELIENCTMEELADMVIKYQNASEVKNEEIRKLKWTISNLEESNGRLQARVDTYVNFILPRATKEAKELLDKNAFPCIRIVAIDEEKKKCDCEKSEKRTPFTDKELAEKWEKLAKELNEGVHKEIEKNEKLKDELKQKETIINQIDDILKKLFGVTHDIADTPDELEKILREKLENNKTIADLLPEEPIKVADMLISAEINSGICSLFDESELRQIAEHLIIYCNANMEEEE